VYANEVVFYPSDNKLDVSVPSSAGADTRQFDPPPVDPYAGTVGAHRYRIGSETGRNLRWHSRWTDFFTHTSEGCRFQVVRYNVLNAEGPVASFPIGLRSDMGNPFGPSGIAVSPDNV
jgi:hypothetical protein